MRVIFDSKTFYQVSPMVESREFFRGKAGQWRAAFVSTLTNAFGLAAAGRTAGLFKEERRAYCLAIE